LDRLGPDEEGEITAKVNTGMRTGRLHKTVKVISNDPEKTESVLSLKATIINSILPTVPGLQILPRKPVPPPPPPSPVSK
jgi:hypothetical protein